MKVKQENRTTTATTRQGSYQQRDFWPIYQTLLTPSLSLSNRLLWSINSECVEDTLRLNRRLCCSRNRPVQPHHRQNGHFRPTKQVAAQPPLQQKFHHGLHSLLLARNLSCPDGFGCWWRQAIFAACRFPYQLHSLWSIYFIRMDSRLHSEFFEAKEDHFGWLNWM